MADKGKPGATGLHGALVPTTGLDHRPPVTPTRRARDHNPKAAQSTPGHCYGAGRGSTMNVLAATRAYVDRIVSDPNNPGMKVLLLDAETT